MATVTKPIALDESINTTEQTPRNIADVLAEELAGIAGAITTSESVEDILSDMATTKDAQVISGTAVFDTIDGNLVKALKVAITPSQAGSGTPSPSNIRPISGYTEEVISVKDSTDTTQETYTTPFNQTVYGGTLDVLTGELTIDRFFFSLNGTEPFYMASASGINPRRFLLDIANELSAPAKNTVTPDDISSHFKYKGTAEQTDVWGTYRTSSTYLTLPDANSAYASATDVKNYFATQYANGTPAQFSYRIATPTTLSLTPQTVKALVGENHIQASTGDVLQCKYSMMINGDDLVQLLT